MENTYKLTRKELKETKASDFKEGDVVLCGKYYIHIEFKKSRRAALHSKVNTVESMCWLPLSKWPLYISNFVQD